MPTSTRENGLMWASAPTTSHVGCSVYDAPKAVRRKPPNPTTSHVGHSVYDAPKAVR